MSSLKRKTVNGLKWNFIEKISLYGIRFVLGVVLARLLVPSDYGITGLIAVFLVLSDVFVSSGFGSALIRKPNATDLDYSTVFHYNAIVSFVCWAVLFFCRHLIANFFHVPLLNRIVPILGINVLINAFGLVQRVRMMVRLDFKSQAMATMMSIVVSGIAGIVMAYNGYGVWSLVYQSLIGNVVNTALLWYFQRWVPRLQFSLHSLKELFSFGSKMMLTSFIGALFNNIYTVMIGKFFSASDLGFYSRAKQFADLPSMNITSAIQVVTYPVLSRLQDDNIKLIAAFRRILKMVMFLVIPLMTGLLLLAKPLILFTLKDKWASSIPLLQLLCIGGILYPMLSLNLILLHVKGRSDLFLRLEIVKDILITLTLLITYSISVKAMIVGSVLVSSTVIAINAQYIKKLLGYSLIQQVYDIMPTILLTLFMAIVIWLSTHFVDGNLLRLLSGFFAGGACYLGAAHLLGFSEAVEAKKIFAGEI